MSSHLTVVDRQVMRFNREDAAIWHGVTGVHREVQEDLFDLARVSGHGPKLRGERQAELDVPADGAPQQLFDAAHDLWRARRVSVSSSELSSTSRMRRALMYFPSGRG